jgi:hypothetical protein
VSPTQFLGILALALGVLMSGAASGVGAQEADPADPVGSSAAIDPHEAGRVYLGQSLAALAWARRYAESAARAGGPDGFDLARYRAELDTVIDGLERYLRPQGPPGGPLTPVEITGQFLLEGLRGRTPEPSSEAKP